MSLAKYRQKRDFAKTEEPAGRALRRGGNSYVIQKHAASHLHYDFRLELDGVLLSWAVPKGPTLDPSVKRLAVQTEDHPIEYGGFEGSIPEGEYGGGTVMVWDRGTWEPEGDARQGYAKGHLAFQLHGQKLSGGWHLVKTQRGGEKQNTWLLFKAKDDAAKPGDTTLLEKNANSALTGRDLKAIAAGVASKPKKTAAADRKPAKGSAKSEQATHKPKRATARAKEAAGKPEKAAGKPEKAAGKPKQAAGKPKKAAGKPKKAAGKLGEASGKSGKARPPGKAVGKSGMSAAKPPGASAKAAKAAKPPDVTAKLAKATAKPLKNAAKNAAKPAKVARAAMPERIEPELATLVSVTPEGDDYIHEVKFDGYRVIARLDDGEVQLLTRGGEDWTARMPTLEAALGKLKAKQAILDGEFVALNEQGVTDFQLLQNSFSGKSRAPLAYYAFDLLYLDGADLRELPLVERKAKLKELLDRMPKSETTLRYSDHTQGQGARFFEEATKLGLEGVVSKRANSPYRSGRGKDWQKSKSLARQEFVIVGFTDPGGGRAHLGALLLGVRRAGQVVYSGRVGTGFSERSLKDLHARLAPLEIAKPKLENAPRGADIRGVHWVEPELVAEVAYTAITDDGLLRHPTFKGLREDKPARDVVLEQPRAVASRTSSKKPSSSASQKPAPSIALTHPDKVLYPELGLTKRELAEYYQMVSDVMLPHVVNRPLTLLRCPEGWQKHRFFQKHPGETLAEGLVRVQVPSSDGQSEYAAIADARGLPALVQMGALEAHISGALASDAEHPDRLVFDLDPAPDVDFKATIAGAKALRQLLEELGLKSWVKTTGGKGLHVTVPIVAQAGWDEVKEFCRAVAEELTRRDPELYLATMSKAKRRGKIFIDYLRNGRGATFIAPYSTRAREGATVAMPVEWEDLSPKFKPEQFNVRSAEKYLNARKVDPFATLSKFRQKLPSLAKAAALAEK